jgi:hypothetical protein
MQIAHGLYGNQPVTVTAVEREQIPTIPTEGRRSTSWRLIAFIPTLAKRILVSKIVLYGSNFANGCYINTLQMSSSYITTCWQAMQVLRVRVCSCYRRTLVSSPLQSQILGWNRQKHFRVPLSATWQTAKRYHDFLETVLPRQLVPVVVRLRFRFQHDAATAYYWEDALQELNATYTGRWIWRRRPIEWPLIRRIEIWWIFLSEDTCRSMFIQPVPGLSKISWQDFKQLWQRLMRTCQDVRDDAVRRTAVCSEMDAGWFDTYCNYNSPIVRSFDSLHRLTVMCCLHTKLN